MPFQDVAPLTREVDACLPPVPPGGSFLRDFVTYAHQMTDAPDAYHLGVALSLFGVAVADRVSIPRGPVGIPPILWVILVGRSGFDRKTTCITIGTNLVQHTALHARITQGSSSAEGLQRMLSEQPTRLMIYKEFVRQASSGSGGNYEVKQRRLMMELYDPTDGEFKHDLGKGTKNRIVNHRLGMLAACALPHLQHNSKREDWDGGLFNRSIMIYASRGERNQTLDSPDPIMHADLSRRIDMMTTAPHIPTCKGFTRKADDLWQQWERFNDQRALKAHDLIQSFFGRMGTTGWKIAMLYALDMGQATHDGWLIDDVASAYAIQFCEKFWIPSVEMIATKVILTPEGEAMMRVEGHVENAGTAGISKGELMRMTRMGIKKLNEAIEGCLLAELIFRISIEGGEIYKHTRFHKCS